jgi:hypothetical protein
LDQLLVERRAHGELALEADRPDIRQVVADDAQALGIIEHPRLSRRDDRTH